MAALKGIDIIDCLTDDWITNGAILDYYFDFDWIGTLDCGVDENNEVYWMVSLADNEWDYVKINPRDFIRWTVENNIDPETPEGQNDYETKVVLTDIR